jgi:drug/metabolite transporter (DMT)-like permease
MTSRLTMSLSDWVLLIVLSVLWGGSYFFVEIAVEEIPPLTLALFRCAVAAAMLLVYVRAKGFALPGDAETWRGLIVLSVMNTVLPFTLIFWGQTYISSSLAGILNATAPLFSIVLAHLATADDRLTPGRAVGVTIGFIGAVIIIGPNALRDFGVNVLAQLALIGSAFCYAASGVYGRRFKALPPSAVAASIMMLGAIMLLPMALLYDRPWLLPWPSATATGAAFGLAVLSTALAFLIYFRILSRAGAVNFQLVAYLIPVTAVLLGVGFLGETIELRHLAGMALIALGLAAIDGRPWRMLTRYANAREIRG